MPEQYCYNHPDRPTQIVCRRCGRPICPDCMVEAAVGFQCPSCVREGMAQTRAATGPFGGVRSMNPSITSLTIIAINLAVWLLLRATGGSNSPWTLRLGLLPQGICLSASDANRYYPDVTQAACQASGDGRWVRGLSEGAYWQLITSIFTHVEVMHILLTCVAIWFLGPGLERVIGRARFIALYLVAGLTGSVFVYWLSPANSISYGGSGALFGLMAALLVLVHRIKGDLRQILMWLGINVAFTIFVPGISWQAHLGGFIGGLLVTAALVYLPQRNRERTQWVVIAGLVVVLFALAVLRTVLLS